MAKLNISELPLSIDLDVIVPKVCSSYLAEAMEALEKNQSVIIECDKIMVNELIKGLKKLNESKGKPVEFAFADGRGGKKGPVVDIIDHLLKIIGEFRGCIVVPNFDLVVSSDQTGSHLDKQTRDLMAIIHQHPNVQIVAFKDPHLFIPKTVMSFFSKQIHILGIDRTYMSSIITQDEAKRIHPTEFDPYLLYKYVSGLNIVKLRKLLHGFTSTRYIDGMGEVILNEIRKATFQDADAELPFVKMESIGGYDNVKTLIKEDILGLLKYIETMSEKSSFDEIKELEKLIPRNILFTGPPGTGKTFFCKALATELNATVFIVNGPELKNKWVGESERAIRNVYLKARKCAPSLVIFDEIDSFGKERGGSGFSTSSSSGGSHSDSSMLNQLLTEMDGFHSSEMIFTIATTNLASSLDSALLSRFKYHIEVPYPEKEDRKAILQVLDKAYGLDLAEPVLQTLIEETELWIDQNKWIRFSGRELESLVSALARYRVVESYKTGSPVIDIPITEELALREVHKKIRTKPIEVSFDDIGGYGDVKEKLNEEIICVLKKTKDLPFDKRVTVENLIPKGVIFEGPPGTGKTMFAKALANDLEATISVVNGPELKGSLVGQTEERIREIYNEARKNAPSVIVFDELDSIASSRENAVGSHDHSVVNQLLTELDGVSEKGLVFTVATTNFARSIDKALRRPGRFEYVIHIPYPDDDARKEIVSIYNQKYLIDMGYDGLSEDSIKHIVFRTDNWVDPDAGIKFSGDHIEAIFRAISRKKLMNPEWTETKDSLDQIIAQRTKKPLDLSSEEEIIVATHEAGHAIIAMHVEGCRPIKRISIASEYDGSLGYVLHQDMGIKLMDSQEDLLAEICCLMGGRVAEKILLGKVSTGATQDIEQATVIATHLAATYGMDPGIGPRMVLHPLIHGDKGKGTNPELIKKVDDAVDKIIHEQEEVALKCIKEHWDEYNGLREELMDKKVVEFKES